ncbi:MAG: glutaminase [Cytophagales bacterium]|nr:glutaminase [Cytophaga sp.]
MNFDAILAEIAYEILPYKLMGEVPTYIPELSNINPDKFGMSIHTMHGNIYSIGDSFEKFSIQSISKVFSVSLAYSIVGENIWKRVGVEPSGTRFNSLIQLELEQGIPRNPFINAGAIVVCDILLSLLQNPKEDYIQYVRRITGIPSIDYNYTVVASEQATGYRNAALVNFMKSFGNIQNNPDAVLDLYYHACSIEMTCQELSRAFILFANQGYLYDSNEYILTRKQTKRINGLMQTCGFYDEAGEFAFRVGLPGKSGVGGGIVAACPKEFTVAVWSPRLNKKGNSVIGMKALELLTDKTGISVF